MLIAIGSARAVPGRRDQLVSAAREVVAATRLDDGCASYGFYADLNDEDTIVSLEIWRDQSALDAHMTHAHTRNFMDRIADLLDGEPHMTLHQISAPDQRQPDPQSSRN